MTHQTFRCLAWAIGGWSCSLGGLWAGWHAEQDLRAAAFGAGGVCLWKCLSWCR